MGWYEWLYSKVGGRPWSYIIRDSYHQRPLLWLAIMTVLGVLLGHLFWGTAWLPGQTGG